MDWTRGEQIKKRVLSRDYHSSANSRDERCSGAGNRWRAVNKDVPRYFCPAVHRPPPPRPPPSAQSRVTRRLFYYTQRKHRGHKRTTRVPPERRELPPRPPVSDAVCSENALLFHRDKKFNVWIITSELIDRQRGRGTRWGTGGR